MKWIFFFVLLIILNTSINAQNTYGKITGKVVEEKSNDPMPFVFISIQGEENQKATAQTDFNGNYEIDSLASGIYTLQYSEINYNQQQIKNILVQAPQTLTLPTIVMTIKKTNYQLSCFPPVISLYENPSETVISRNEIEHMPMRK